LILDDFFPPSYIFSIVVGLWFYQWWSRLDNVGHAFVD